MRLYKYVPVLS